MMKAKHNDAQHDILPDDLQALFNSNKKAYRHYQAFPGSSRRIILKWIAAARTPAARRQRIELTVALATENIKAHH
ncbi:MAG TPA: YdeI/OmpD-associated family protein [Chitinophaga sp.]|uniref:YdeI/OmpD-associated family protein n=1 Tax=Chitinophaga sp. TaxID=1869181 RepID=UPI002BBFCCAB|nr:YdeI/OmpD-associated family protein [Chitinophaga sp.]HVI47823.1 YdeI/OmpD-associated family protein [Chitinophaga sp.]